MRDTTRHTRRRFLSALAAASAVGVAGCSSGGDGGGGDGEMTSEGGMDDDMTSEGGMDDDMTSEGGMDDDMTSEGGMDDETTTGDEMAMGTFTVTVENVSEPGTLTTSEGEDLAVPLAPVAYAVHDDMATGLVPGEAASAGLESLAEDGTPGTLVDEWKEAEHVKAAGAAATPVGADSPGPIGPGGSYEFTVQAEPGARLSLATMFVQSNDLFYAFDPQGLPLYDGESTMGGDVTEKLSLWDAGTEVNQEPGVGSDQAPRQSGADTGADEDGTVRPIADVDDGYDYPDDDEVIRVVVTAN
jgi:hypothetical protein